MSCQASPGTDLAPKPVEDWVTKVVVTVLKVDLHLHSREDPLDHIAHDAFALIDRAGRLGFDALALTLHDRQLTDRRVFEYARARGIILIPGVERTLRGRHVLLINFPKSAEDVTSFDEIARLKANHNGLVIAPHPFFPDRKCLRGMIDERPDIFDAVEWSYFWTTGINFNTRATLWAHTHGKPVVGNSDTHDLRQLGRTFSCNCGRPRDDGARLSPHRPLLPRTPAAVAVAARRLPTKMAAPTAFARTMTVEIFSAKTTGLPTWMIGRIDSTTNSNVMPGWRTTGPRTPAQRRSTTW